MVDGDFKKFEGKWSIKYGTRYNPCIHVQIECIFFKEKVSLF